MKVYEILTESKQQEPAKPRNFVAKNARATTSGAGAHKDKKKAAKQGYEKHKKQGVTESVNNIVQQILSESSLGDFLPPFSANGLWINDRRGNSVAEVRGHGSLAKEVADALNQYVSKKGVAEGSASVDFKGRPVDQELVKKQGKYWDQAAKEKKQQELKRSKQLRQQGVAEGIFDIFKKLPASGSTVKIAGRPVEITHAGVGSDYIGFAWTDKNGKEHYEETPAEEHDNLRSLAKTIAAEIKYADDDGVDDELDAQIKGRLDRHFGKKKQQGVAENIQSVDDWKAAVLQAYPQYADKIKFKGRGLQINAEIPGVDRSFGVYDLGSESGEVLHETATAGATSAGNIATVTSPHLAIGGARGNKSYTGSPGKSGTKAPKPPKTLQKKKADGTAVNALDMKNNIFGGGPVKR